MNEGQGAKGQGPAVVERPALANETGDYWGSDVMALMLREVGLPYVALNPGASYRGLHDSLVNLLGNTEPQMLLCLHEEHAVAIAHGYAKVAGKPMGAIVHSNVGLMHATMAIFNAWCDRVPVILFGATGPVAADKRRPWIDWIHTAADQGALIRNYTKWDDQPNSVGAVPESVLRAYKMATTAPQGPVYVCFDAALQETRIGDLPALPSADRFKAPAPAAPDPAALAEAAALLDKAERPVIMVGRFGRGDEAWARRVQLAEALDATVMTDPKTGSGFPTAHRLQGPPAGNQPSPEALALLREADVILSLDWVDLGGALKTAYGDEPVKAKVILASLDHQLHNGWSMDYQGLPPADIHLAVAPDVAVAALLPLVKRRPPRPAAAPATAESAPEPPKDVITPVSLAGALREAIGGRTTCLIRTPLAWGGHAWETSHPLDMLGGDGGGGIGGGPGMAVGAALALRGSARLPIAVLGDGDTLMGITALWTAVHYRIPVMIVVANNNSFFNDELHQDRMARQRERPVANRWIGQRIADPEPDLATLARGQGATGYGPVRDPAELARTLRQAIETVEAGGVALVDVRVEPGYATSMGAHYSRR
ncbi:MAG TPA: thiamine pyrophosphate-dependent enzyme [Stellaceae bacterium]|jgi:thiamine pyrophosphate-dependent acetolactate synthase large subunit-like protein|nr:thiamine pyrophosphate-dependent enzyme [Stellaceae bacterium]